MEKSCAILKKTNIQLEDSNLTVFEYVISCNYDDREDNNSFELNGKIVYSIRNINTVNSEYFFIPLIMYNGTRFYNDAELEKINDLYDGKFVTVNRDNDGYCLEMIEIVTEDEKTNDNTMVEVKKVSPIDIYNNIVSIVKGQDEHVKSVLASILWNERLNNSDLSKDEIAKNKHNLLIMGSTGTGKTEIVRQISKNMNIPVAVVDATTYTEAGYVGNSVDDMLVRLYMMADKNLEKAQRSILVIDEFDKLAKSKNTINKGVNKEGVQKSLLTLIEGSKREIAIDRNVIEFDTCGLTVIFLGAFSELEKTRSNTNNRMIGFNSEQGFRQKVINTSADKIDALVNYGIEPEILGRINVIKRLNPMTKDILLSILKSPKGRLMSMVDIFKQTGVDVEIDENYLEVVAEMALADNKGARSLNRVIDELIVEDFSKVMFGESKLIRVRDRH